MVLLTKKSAEDNFREAFERLKIGAPRVMPADTPVSQNNVAKEAGCDPSALRKSRFPSLVAEIQNFLATQEAVPKVSERQKVLKKRQQSRASREAIDELRKQNSVLSGWLLDCYEQIVLLTRKNRDLEVRLEMLRPKATTIPLPSTKAKSKPIGMDMTDAKEPKK